MSMNTMIRTQIQITRRKKLNIVQKGSAADRTNRPVTFPAFTRARHLALADSGGSPAGLLGAVVDEVGDDDRGREEEQAEDEIPDEAVALPAGDTGGPERDRDPDDSKQDPPKDGHGRVLSAFMRTLVPAAGRQRLHRRCRTGLLCAPPRHHPGRGDLRWC